MFTIIIPLYTCIRQVLIPEKGFEKPIDKALGFGYPIDNKGFAYPNGGDYVGKEND